MFEYGIQKIDPQFRRLRSVKEMSNIEELQRQTEDMGEDLLPHVVHHSLARVLQQIDLYDAEDKSRQQRHQEEHRQTNDAIDGRAAKRF